MPPAKYKILNFSKQCSGTNSNTTRVLKYWLQTKTAVKFGLPLPKSLGKEKSNQVFPTLKRVQTTDIYSCLRKKKAFNEMVNFE